MFSEIFSVLFLCYVSSNAQQDDRCLSFNYPDIVFVLDTSGSICDTDPLFRYGVDTTCNNFKNLTNFLHELVIAMPIDPNKTMVGAVRFSSKADVLWTLDKYKTKEELLTAIDSIEYNGGNTATSEALHKMRTQVFGLSSDRLLNPNIALVITDGKATTGAETLYNEINANKDANIQVYVVGVTQNVNISQIKDISSEPHLNEVNYFKSATFQSLNRVANSIVTSTNIICPTGSTTPIPINLCTNNTYPDLVLALDISGSICDADPNKLPNGCKNFENYISFTINLIEKLNISRSETLVGVILFETNAYVKWNLDAYPFKHDLIAAIRDISYVGGYTYTSGALRLMRTQIFNTPADRPDHPNVAIVITDGKPTIENYTLPAEIALLHKENISVFVIGITNDIDELIVSNISSAPHSLNINYFKTPNYSTLSSLQNQLQSASKISCGETEPVNSCTLDPYPDVIFLLDKSGSICDNSPVSTCPNFVNYINFVKSLVNQMEVGENFIHVAVISFDDQARIEWGLNKYQSKANLLSAIQNISYTGGWTYTSDALKLLRTMILGSAEDRPNNPNIGIIITDGNPTVGVVDLQTEINLLMATNNIKMFAVGVLTAELRLDILKNLSSHPKTLGRNYFTSTDFSTINNISSELLMKSGLQCSTTTSMFNPNISTAPPNTCMLADIVLILDHSGSICSDSLVNGSCPAYRNYNDFVVELVKGMDVSLKNIHVAVVSFDNALRINWNLNGYLNKDDLLDEIKNLEYFNGEPTDISSALHLIRTQIFNGPSDRKSVPNIAIFITDGYSNQNSNSLKNEIVLNERHDIITYLIGVGLNINLEELKMISSPPRELGKNYYIVTDFMSLGQIREQFMNNTINTLINIDCDQKVSTSVTPVCKKSIELAFLIDMSGSIGPENFRSALNLAQKISNFLHNNLIFNMAMITYDTKAYVQWNLTRFTDTTIMLRRISELMYGGADTNTTGAIKTCRMEVFNKPLLSGIRCVVLITDGLNTIKVNHLKNEINQLIAMNVNLYAIGNINSEDETDFASMLPSPKNQINVNYFTQIDDNTANILQNLIVPSMCD